jgi:TRAP-type mannitol/chloroaromatic compound transport system permease small subunit
MRNFVRIIENISRYSGHFISYLLIPILGVAFFEVVMRYLFHRPTVWATESIIFGCAFVYVIGAAWTMLTNRHVKIDLVYEKISLRGQKFLDFITFFFFALYIGFMLWVGFNYAWESFQLGETTGSNWSPPIYPVKIAFVIGVFLLLLQGIAKAICDIYFVITGKEL